MGLEPPARRLSVNALLELVLKELRKIRKAIRFEMPGQLGVELPLLVEHISDDHDAVIDIDLSAAHANVVQDLSKLGFEPSGFIVERVDAPFTFRLQEKGGDHQAFQGYAVSGFRLQNIWVTNAAAAAGSVGRIGVYGRRSVKVKE